MIRRSTRTAFLLLSLCAALVPAPAHADRKEEAHAAADRGERLFSKGVFDQALTEYQASYDKYPKPFLLFRIGECQRKLVRDAEALATYKKYLEKVSKGGDRKKAEAYVAELQAKLEANKKPEPEPEPPKPVAQAPDVEAPPMTEAQVAAVSKVERHNKKGKKGVSGPPAETTAKAPKEDHLPPGWDPNAPPPDRTPAYEEPAEPAGPKPLYKKWWLWTAVGGALVIGAGVAIGLVYGLPKFTSELPVGGPGAATLSVHPQSHAGVAVRF